MFFFSAKAQPCWRRKPCKESWWPQPWLIIWHWGEGGIELCESALKVAVSGPYLSSSSGHVVVTGAGRCDLNPLRWGGGGDTHVKHVSRPIKLQIHNVTVIRFSVPEVLLLPAQTDDCLCVSSSGYNCSSGSLLLIKSDRSRRRERQLITILVAW